ncbi:hypothetical protein [Chitinimonas taiwanensis]|uniref:hypothetical protein n=1 Tax=Chitinimonas taiwanensis TaxID=240412 RepID=UPI0035B48F77
MIDLSSAFDEIRSILLNLFPEDLSDWPVLHTVIAGPTLEENHHGVGPWARILALPMTTPVLYPSGYPGLNRDVSYIVALYVPRVFTTDNVLESLIHEYLHIGTKEGSINHHPPREESEFIAKSQIMAKIALSESAHLRTLDIIRKSWNDLRSDCIIGLNVHGFELSHEKLFSKGVVAHQIYLSELN